MSETEGFALDYGPLSLAVEALLEEASVGQWIAVRPRTGVTEFVVTGIPTGAWSTGEKLLWELCLSAAGRGSVNLAMLGNYFRATPLRDPIIDVLGLVLGRE